MVLESLQQRTAPQDGKVELQHRGEDAECDQRHNRGKTAQCAATAGGPARVPHRPRGPAKKTARGEPIPEKYPPPSPPLQVDEGGPQLPTGRMAKGSYRDSSLTSYGWSGSQKLPPGGDTRRRQDGGPGPGGEPEIPSKHPPRISALVRGVGQRRRAP